VPEEPVPTFHEGGSTAERDGSRNQPDHYAALVPDPASAEGEAEEEDRAEDEREPADPGEGTPCESRLDLLERPGQVGELDHRRQPENRLALDGALERLAWGVGRREGFRERL